MFVGRLVFVCLLWAELTTALLSPLQHSALMRLYDLLGCTDCERFPADGECTPGVAYLTCERDTVVEINLSDFGLSGYLPTEIASLISLKSLVLSNNGLTGSLPSEIGRLTNLQLLLLASNRFSGVVPTTIALLSSMVALNLGGNSFSGTLPSAIGLFRELDALFLHFNNFGGTIPSSFVALTKLKALYLNSNQLRGTLPGQLVGALTRLTTLLLNNNAFNGTLPLEIRLLVSLRELDISFNRFYGTISQIPATVQMCTAQLNGDTNCFVCGGGNIGGPCVCRTLSCDQPTTLSPTPTSAVSQTILPMPTLRPTPGSTSSSISTRLPTPVPTPSPTLPISTTPRATPSAVTFGPSSRSPTPIPTPVPTDPIAPRTSVTSTLTAMTTTAAAMTSSTISLSSPPTVTTIEFPSDTTFGTARSTVSEMKNEIDATAVVVVDDDSVDTMHIGIIAGSVGGICLLVCAIAAIFVLWRRSRGDISIDSNAGSAIMYSSNSGGIVSARGDEYGAVNFGASEYDVGDVGQSEGYVNGRDLLAHGRVNYPALT